MAAITEAGLQGEWFYLEDEAPLDGASPAHPDATRGAEAPLAPRYGFLKPMPASWEHSTGFNT
jgi:hypothetical protein